MLLTACSGSDSSRSSDDIASPTVTAAVVDPTAAPPVATDPSTTVPAVTTTAAPTTTTEPRPTPAAVKVTGPISGGKGMANTSLQDLAGAGFVEEEYFFEGDATAYANGGELSQDGVWTITPDTTEAFRSRIIVRRPAAAADFSGTVVVEWLNVSAGNDGDPDWGYNHREILREGHAWVGVSAQAVGVSGGQSVLSSVPASGGLVATDPERYGTLIHPGDRYSFDMFSQAAAALINPDGPDPLGGLQPSQVVAMGESQSAFFMTSYINGVHPLVQLFDGFLVHSRGNFAPSFDTGTSDRSGDVAYKIRTDLDDPVMIFTTETDLTILGYSKARQDDTESVRSWEVAGTAHADAFLLQEVYGLGENADPAALLNCTAPLNSGPQHEVLQAAFHHLIAWISDGSLPPTSPRLDLVDGDPVAIKRDDRGNAIGGIRTPLVDVPIATLSGDPVEGSGGGFCFLFGSTRPFDAATLAGLYPTRDAYATAFARSRDEAVAAGYMLAADVDAMTERALNTFDRYTSPG
jgi:Alpha/beta hydrolase domain